DTTLVSSNGQWKFGIPSNKQLQIVHYLDPTTPRWTTYLSLNVSRQYGLVIQGSGESPDSSRPEKKLDANFVYRDDAGKSVWAANPCNNLNTSMFGQSSAMILSDDGVLFEYYRSTQALIWRSSMISVTHISLTSTNGEVIRVSGNFSVMSASATLEGVAIRIALYSSYVLVTVPKGVGSNLTLLLYTCSARIPVLLSYPPPTKQRTTVRLFSRAQSSTIIFVNGTNAGTNSSLCINSSTVSLSCVNVSGGNYSTSIPVPIHVPTSLLYLSLQWIETGDIFNLTTINYTSPLDASLSMNSGMTVDKIFETIEIAAQEALISSDVYERTSADGLSIYAAIVQKNGNASIEGRLNGTATGSFSIPPSVMETLSRGNNSTRVTVILSQIPFTVFPRDISWTILGNTVGLSLYVNGTYANVRGDERIIKIRMSLPSITNVTAELGVDTVTCLCNHLTNFTIGRYNPPVIVNPTIENVGSPINREEGGFNKLYLIAIAGIVPIVLTIIIKKRKKAIYCEPSLDIASNTNDDVQIEREIGRGRQSTVYLGKKSGTTAVAVKKSGDRERTKTLIIEANMLKDMHHPNVLLYLGMYREEGMTCLVTDYMDGNTLDHALRKGMISDGEQAQNMMKEIAAGMIYLHENRVIHGRMCPQKVYVTSSMHVKISAYGSQSVDQLPQYMEKYLAPEVKKSRQLTIEGDIYSCGVIYAEILDCVGADEPSEPVRHWREVIELCTTEVAAERKSMRIVGRRMNSRFLYLEFMTRRNARRLAKAVCHPSRHVRGTKDRSTMKTQTNVVLLLLAIVFHGHALFTGSTVLNSSGAPLNNCTLVSSNGQWKFEIAEDKTLHIVHYQDPTTSRWIPNFSIANTSGSFNLYIQYSGGLMRWIHLLKYAPDGNIVYRRNYYDILWASNSACMLNSATNKASTLILSDDGVLFQYYSSPQLLVWRTSMISDTHVSVPTTDGGTIRVMGNFSTGIATATLNGVATNRAVGLSSSYASVFIPKGAGFNLTLMLRTCNAFHPVLISYPPPTAPSIGIQSPFIIVNGTNAGTNSLLCIHSLLPTILSCVNVSGGNYSPSIRVPLSVPTSLLYVSLRWIETGDTFNLTVFNYTSPQDAFANVNVSGNTAEEIFETIENAALGALTSSDTYERTSADGVSIYAAVANKNGNTTEGRLNGTATTSFSIPSSVIESLSRGNNGTGVTVVLSRIPFTVFPKDANWTILGDTIGLSLYVNMTHANVSGSQSLIEITMSLPADVNVTK
ncbi:protein kinase family protein, partial [Planoprotostelium fungivorum]